MDYTMYSLYKLFLGEPDRIAHHSSYASQFLRMYGEFAGEWYLIKPIGQTNEKARANPY